MLSQMVCGVCLWQECRALVVETANIPMITVRRPPPGESHDRRSMIKGWPGKWHSLYSDIDCSKLWLTCRLLRVQRSKTKSARFIVLLWAIMDCFQFSLFSNIRSYAFSTLLYNNKLLWSTFEFKQWVLSYMMFTGHYLINLNTILWWIKYVL